MKKAIVVGATSGIGHEVATMLINQGWKVGVCGRRTEKLDELKSINPNNVFVQAIDITNDDAPQKLLALITQMDGIDLYLHVSGIGFQNLELDIDKELATAETNVVGFTRMIDTAFLYFAMHPDVCGHIACVSSIAGTKGLGSAPSYSASKRYCNTYMEALEQLSNIKGMNIAFSDIRPGFVDTDLLKGSTNYPMLMKADKVARTIVSGLERKKRVITINWRYKVVVFFWRLVPKSIWVRLKVTASQNEKPEK